MSDFRVDRVSFPSNVLNAGTVRQLAKLGEEAGQWAPKNDTWDALAERTEKTNELSRNDYSHLRRSKEGALKYQGKLINGLLNKGWRDPNLAQKIEKLQAFIVGVTGLTDTVRSEQARIAIEAAGGATLGAAGIAAAYVGTKFFRDEEVKELVGKLEDLETGKSAQVIAGNIAEPVHHEEVWPKMLNLVDKATQSAKEGKPLDVEGQYFELSNPEFLGKLAEAAQAGNRVRVNVDPGNLNPFQTEFKLDSIAVKLNALLKLHEAGVGISCFPIAKQLGDVENIMHRKVLRVGDEVLLSGMNANEGSGENLDGGYVIQGPAAAQLGKNLARDIENSRGAGYTEIYGKAQPGQQVNGLKPHIGTRGLMHLFDAATGPSPAAAELPRPENFQELQKMAKDAGFNLSELVEIPQGQSFDEAMKSPEGMLLTAKGAEAVGDLMNRVIELANSPENLKRLDAVGEVDGTPKGNQVVAVSDLPDEREALLLHGISQAEKFCYLPAYIMTRPVANALAARRKELQAQGKDLDVRVVVDAAVFPDQGSPNTLGAVKLEDIDIPVRWVTLPRSSDHDRKLHAKMMLTEKGEYFGSTNFSAKGLKENWEESGMVMFENENDPRLAKAKDRFLRLWDQMSVPVDSRDLAAIMASRYGGGELLEGALREESLRGVIKQIEAYEVASAKWMTEQGNKPEVAARAAELHREGVDEGSALLLAVEQTMGSEAYFKALANLPEHKKLLELTQAGN